MEGDDEPQQDSDDSRAGKKKVVKMSAGDKRKLLEAKR